MIILSVNEERTLLHSDVSTVLDYFRFYFLNSCFTTKRDFSEIFVYVERTLLALTQTNFLLYSEVVKEVKILYIWKHFQIYKFESAASEYIRKFV